LRWIFRRLVHLHMHQGSRRWMSSCSFAVVLYWRFCNISTTFISTCDDLLLSLLSRLDIDSQL
jgi:hypothetical protein